MKINTQTITKQDLSAPDSLSVNSIFYTIQGEGPFAGTPAVFIRLAGCNLQCPFCDTEYSSSAIQDPVEITNRAIRVIPKSQIVLAGTDNAPLIVITGGEPFRQDIRRLVKMLLNYGFRVQIETNGTLFIDDFPQLSEVTVVCSPKTGAINKQLAPFIDAYKYIIHAGKVAPVDGLPITSLEHTAKNGVARPVPFGIGHHGLAKAEVFVQPADEQDLTKNQANLATAIESAMTYGYRLCVQVHKIIDME